MDYIMSNTEITEAIQAMTALLESPDTGVLLSDGVPLRTLIEQHLQLLLDVQQQRMTMIKYG